MTKDNSKQLFLTSSNFLLFVEILSFVSILSMFTIFTTSHMHSRPQCTLYEDKYFINTKEISINELFVREW